MTDQHRYRAFYCFYGTDRDVPSDRAEEISGTNACLDLLGSLQREGDFFGLIDERGTTLQVMYEADDDQYWVEIPVRQKSGSYGRHMALNDVVALFEALPKHFSTTSIEQLKFVPWS